MELETANLPARRIEAIDAVRGSVMILMALDHVRDFIHRGAMTSSPTDLATTTPVLFLTRWVTHLCAPTFMLTAGLGAFLWWRRGKTRQQLSTFLVTRGLWLMVLELTVMRLAYNFNFSQHYPFLLLVLWVLGACMIGLAALVWLPMPVLTVLSLAMIALHNCLDGIDGAQFGSAAPVWNLIHQPGAFSLAGGTVIVGYPLVPWIAVMALGFCLGPIFLKERADPAAVSGRDRRRRSRWVRRPPRSERIRRSRAMGHAKRPAIHGALVSQYHEVPPFARLSAHDVGSGDAGPGLVRSPGPRPLQSLDGVRPGFRCSTLSFISTPGTLWRYFSVCSGMGPAR